MDRLLEVEGSVTPLAVMAAGMLMCLTAGLSGVMQVADSYSRLAALADDEALLVAQRQIFGQEGCPGARSLRGARLEDCAVDDRGSRVVLSREIEAWSQTFRISAVGRYLIAP